MGKIGALSRDHERRHSWGLTLPRLVRAQLPVCTQGSPLLGAALVITRPVWVRETPSSHALWPGLGATEGL